MEIETYETEKLPILYVYKNKESKESLNLDRKVVIENVNLLKDKQLIFTKSGKLSKSKASEINQEVYNYHLQGGGILQIKNIPKKSIHLIVDRKGRILIYSGIDSKLTKDVSDIRTSFDRSGYTGRFLATFLDCEIKSMIDDTRTINLLKNSGFKFMYQLYLYIEDFGWGDLKKIQGIGRASIEVIERAFENRLTS